jgi:hypothetical protein
VKLSWYDHNVDNPPWIKALADVRRMGTLEGYCYFHVQAIMFSIDQYAESALGNREYFLNKPHSIGGRTFPSMDIRPFPLHSLHGAG